MTNNQFSNYMATLHIRQTEYRRGVFFALRFMAQAITM